MKHPNKRKKPSEPRPSGSVRHSLCIAGALAGLIAVFWAYSPALHGPFLFDDNFLPFATSNLSTATLGSWLHGVRPMLMFTYWVNAALSQDDTFSYHVVNVIIHCITAGLVLLIVRRLLQTAPFARGSDRSMNPHSEPRPEGAVSTQRSSGPLLSGFAAALFLLHPVQTEAVAYLAGRSESLSVMLAFAALAVFLYRRPGPISWPAVAVILVLFGAALLAKEHTIVLPALLLLTDYWWSPKSVRSNWRLYAAIAAAGVAGAVFLLPLLLHATTAGFGLKDFTWYQYFFTEWRALFVYLREFILPVNLTADWDFPLSRTILDHGAVIALIALLAISAAAWHYRRRFALAAYGWFVFLLLMAPTSSILPIQDTVAERRLYFAILGLLLILVDFVRRIPIRRQALTIACAVLLLVSAAATHARAAIWSDPVTLWQDNVARSPNKRRDHVNLGFAYYAGGRYQDAIAEFQRTAELGPPTLDLLVDWGLAYQKLGNLDLALAKFREAAALQPPSAVAYVNIAQVYGTRRDLPDALDALAVAEKLDPGLPDIYLNRGKVHLLSNEPAAAAQDFARVLSIDPSNSEAQQLLVRARQSSPAK